MLSTMGLPHKNNQVRVFFIHHAGELPSHFKDSLTTYNEVERKKVVEIIKQEDDVFITELAVEHIMTFSLAKMSTMVQGKEVRLGVTNINIESGGVEEEEEPQKNDNTIPPTSLLFHRHQHFVAGVLSRHPLLHHPSPNDPEHLLL